jgi:glycosyltransferase involved in cell wall biosynthesis
MNSSRLLIIQYMGDYRQAYIHFSKGGDETYYAQRSSVDFVAELGREIEQVGVLCCRSDVKYDEVVGNGVRAMGAGWTGRSNTAPVFRMIEQFRPTHLVLGTPHTAMLNWAVRRGTPVLPMFADTFNVNVSGLSPLRRLAHRWRHRLRISRLASALNDPRVRWVANHNLNACRSLAQIGVRPEKIVMWDWPAIRRPEMYAPKIHSASGRPWQLVFVGSVTESKGIRDAIDALAELKNRGRPAKFTVIGPGDIELFARHAEARGVGDLVNFEGRQPQTRVIEAMRSADIVVVPSRHEYPEGLPMVIYEALAVRTPLICSDHPAFRGRIGEGEASLMFPQRRPAAFANMVDRLMSDPSLYAGMSDATSTVWEQLQCPVKHGDLIRLWLFGGADTEGWLAEHSLARHLPRLGHRASLA